MTATNAIKRLELAGIKRSDITAALGVTRAAVSHWATGRSQPQGKNLDGLVALGRQRGVELLAADFRRAG